MTSQQGPREPTEAASAAEAGIRVERYRPRPGTTVALCGAPTDVVLRYLAALLRRCPRVATVIVADDDPATGELRAERLEQADHLVVLNQAGPLRWPAARAVAYAAAAGKPIWWLRRPVHRCPTCRSHAVALVAGDLAWCQRARCGWVGDDTAAAIAAAIPPAAELDAGFLLSHTGARAGAPTTRAASQATCGPPSAPTTARRWSNDDTGLAARAGLRSGRPRWLR
jgi:hypothetical protein